MGEYFAGCIRAVMGDSGHWPVLPLHSPFEGMTINFGKHWFKVHVPQTNAIRNYLRRASTVVRGHRDYSAIRAYLDAVSTMFLVCSEGLVVLFVPMPLFTGGEATHFRRSEGATAAKAFENLLST